jgi:glycerophosphoryl diester phosphodiesterase
MQGCIQNPEPLVIAHRGGANLAPENTMAAFEQALGMGVDMIEIDVEQTRDSVIVVIHDRSVDRTTNGTGLVDSLTYGEIRDLDAGSWFDPQYSVERIPTLDQVLEKISGRTKLLIEIKEGSERYPNIERRTVESIRRYNAAKWVVVQSFNLKAVERVKSLYPDIRTYYLLGRNFEAFYQEHFESDMPITPANAPFEGLAVHYSALDPDKIEGMQRQGFGVYTWTVDEEDVMRRFLASGVNGIITDSPDMLLGLLRE